MFDNLGSLGTRSVCLLVGLGLGLVTAPPAVAGTPLGTAMRPLPPGDYVPGEVLVLASGDANRNGRIEAGERLDGVEQVLAGKVTRRMSVGKEKTVYRVQLPADKTVEKAIAENWAVADPRIIAVEPNYRVHILTTPNDTRYPEMWSLNNTGQTGGTPDADIDAPEAWDSVTGSSSIIVAVIDTGVDYLHPDLVNNMWRNPGETGGGKETNGIDDDANGYIDDVYGYDFAMNDPDPSDPNGHGTHCSGTIAASGNNALGTTGVNWQCRIMACRFLGAGGSGDTADAVEAVNYAVANGAKVLSNSWGGGGATASLQAAIENARNHGVLFVAAAGNAAADNDTGSFYPANYPVSNVVSVAATTHTDSLASFSNYGDHSVHLGAPGQSILSTVPHFVTLFTEDFQGATPPGFAGTQMTSEGPMSRWGTVATTVGAAGNIAARADYANSQPYLSGSNGWITTPPMDTRGLRGVVVSSLIRLDIGAGDTFAIDVWDGAAWITLASFSNFTGLYGDFYYIIEAELPENRRAADNRFRWRWVTDSANNNFQGVEIDDITVRYIGGDYTSAYELYSGTSMACPHVSGVAALALAADPTLTIDALKYRLMYGGDLIPAMQGRTISGRRLNANGAVHPLPPTAFDTAALAYATLPVTVSFSAVDDGVPGPLQFVITALPSKGALSDAGGPITTTPHTLPGNTVTYTSQPGVNGVDTFQFVADDGGAPPYHGPSAPATASVTILNCFLFDDFTSSSLDAGNWPVSAPGVDISSTAVAPPSPPGALRLDGYPGGAEFVMSRAMDLSALHGAELRYWYEQGGTLDQPDLSEDLIVEYLDAAGMWIELSRHYGEGPAMTTFESVMLRLPEPAFHPAFQVRFRNIATAGANIQDVWYVDNVCIQEAPAQAPIASSTTIPTANETPVTIALPAVDPNRDPLTFVIVSLPAHGTLSDPQAGAITTVPYTLAASGGSVVYSPAAAFSGSDAFQFKASDGKIPPDGGESDIATVTLGVIPCLGLVADPSPADQATRVTSDPILSWNLSTPPDHMITFDELPYGTVVNGMTIAGVNFSFSSNDATIDGGPGATLYVQTPNIEGNRAGTLTLSFSTPVAGVAYGFVLATQTPQASATSMSLYDASDTLLGVVTADATDHGFSWAEGRNSASVATGIARAVITFTHPEAPRFALDNVELTPMAGTAALASLPTAAGPAAQNPPIAALARNAWLSPVGGALHPAATGAAKTPLDALPSVASDPQTAAALPDYCTSPQPIIGASPILVTASQTSAATTSPGDPAMGCGASSNSNTLWYRIVPAQSGTMVVSTCGSDYDTVLAVWKGSCGALVSLGCSDDSACGLGSTLGVPVEAGVPYLIEVADFSTPGGGELVMTISGVDAACTSPTLYSVLLDTVNPPTTVVCQNLTERTCDPGPAVRAAATYYWRIQTETCCGTALGPVWTFSTAAPADFDADGDVDQTDYAHLQLCLSGATSQTDPACQDAKLAGNAGVNTTDVNLFVKCLGGADLPPPEGCAE